MLEQDPKSQGALEGISLACLALGQNSEAYSYLRKWDKLHPNSPYILDLLARAKNGMSQESGPPAVSQPVSEPPKVANTPSLYDLGTQARERGDHQAAKEAFAGMLRKSPDSPGALEGIVLACLALGQYDEALRYLARWEKIKPGDAYVLELTARAQKGKEGAKAPAAAVPAPTQKSLYALGTEARQRGDYQASKQYFQQMLDENPGSGGALEGLSLACLSLGQYEEARRHLEEWNKNSPRNSYILGLLARAERNLNDDQAALGTYLEMIDASRTMWACDAASTTRCGKTSRACSSKERRASRW